MASKIILLVDTFPILHRGCWTKKTQLFTEKLIPGQKFETTALNAFCHTVIGAMLTVRPTHTIIAIDHPDKSLCPRRKKYPLYKANRARLEEDRTALQQERYEHVKWCSEQLPQVSYGMGLAEPVSLAGYEADDIIGTYSEEVSRDPDNHVYVLSSDRDFAQLLVKNNVTILEHVWKGEKYEIEEYDMSSHKYCRKLQIRTDQFLDFRALAGDPSDNIKGCPLIGEKKASALLNQYGTLDNIYKELPNFKKSKMKENLIQYEADVRVCREIVEFQKGLYNQLPSIDNFTIQTLSTTELDEIFTPYEFSKVQERISKYFPKIFGQNQQHNYQ